MRVLITISGLRFQSDEGAKNRLNSFIDSYTLNGDEVYVLLFFPLIEIKYFFSRKKYLNHNAKWILFPTFPISISKLINKLATTLNQVIFAIISRLRHYDVIQSEVLGGVGGWKPKKSIFIVDFHGDSVSETEFRNFNKPNWLSSIFRDEQKTSIKLADYIIVVSEELKKRLEYNTGSKITDYSIISCGVDIDRFIKAKQERANMDFSDRIVVGYLGGLQKWQNIDKIIDIALNLFLLDKRIFLILYTNSDTSLYKEKLNELGDGNFLIESLSFNQVPSNTKKLDAGFLIRENIPLNIVSSPTKLSEYLAAGVPVICTQFSGDYKRSINHLKEGFILNDYISNSAEIKELMEYLVEIKNNRDFYRSSCQNAAQDRSWELEFSKYMKDVNILFSNFDASTML
jgi:glycosyltransferase involved in cell wall biosynthesis